MGKRWVGVRGEMRGEGRGSTRGGRQRGLVTEGGRGGRSGRGRHNGMMNSAKVLNVCFKSQCTSHAKASKSVCLAESYNVYSVSHIDTHTHYQSNQPQRNMRLLVCKNCTIVT